MLNFGHSFGHALEAYFQFDDTIVTHGEAVAIGMMTSARVAHALGYCALELVGTLEQVLAKHHLPTSLHMLPTFPAFDKLVTAMHHDKKNSHGSLRLLLMHDIGKIEAHHFSADALVTLLESLADNI